MDTKPVSDEQINAFIDSQITDEERQEFLAQMQSDKQLASRVCDLQQLKQMTQLAFRDIPGHYNLSMPSRRFSWKAIAASLVFFVTGLLIGTTQFNLSDRFSDSSSFTPVQDLPNQQQVVTKVLVHLSSADESSARNTLNNINEMLVQYAAQQKQILVEIIANSDGLNLLRVGRSPFADLIRRMTEQHPNLTFLACLNTIENFEKAEGNPIHLLPQAGTIRSGVAQVIKRQQEGWAYIRG